MKKVDKVKAKIQDEALQAIKDNGGKGLVAMATGSGKSKIAINRAKEVVEKEKDANILIVVPTEKLRDVNWYEEFAKWGLESLYNKNIERSCYVSANKIKDKKYNLVILDEAHNITEYNSEFFENNQVEEAIALTATPPEDKVKAEILKKYGFKTVYTLGLDEAVELGLVSPYKITVVECRLDDTEKYIDGGTKAAPFKTTESNQYKYLTRTLNGVMFKAIKTPADNKRIQFLTLNRMRMIYNLKSKTRAAKFLLDKVIPQDERTLIFCGGIEQSIDLCEYRYFSKPSYTKGNAKSKARSERLMEHYEGDKWFNLFKEEKINRLSCINALNEGHNISNVDNAVIVQLSSNEKDLIQRVGRIIRYRKGHVGNIYILVTIDTVDEKWMNEALSSFDASNIEYVRLTNLMSKYG